MIEDVLAQSVGVVVISKFLPFTYGEDLISPKRSVHAESGTKSPSGSGVSVGLSNVQ
jgi:hypothetical protein